MVHEVLPSAGQNFTDSRRPPAGESQSGTYGLGTVPRLETQSARDGKNALLASSVGSVGCVAFICVPRMRHTTRPSTRPPHARNEASLWQLH